MTVNSRNFLRNFAQMKAKASAGETVIVESRGEKSIFKAVKRRTWQGALKGKVRITGNIFSTGVEWDAMRAPMKKS